MRNQPLIALLVALNILVWGGLIAFEAWVRLEATATSSMVAHSPSSPAGGR